MLGIAKNGPKLEKAELGSSSQNSRGSIVGRNISMEGCVEIGTEVDRPVIDRTELPGEFNFKLEWTPEGDKPADGLRFCSDPAAAWLKLEPQKAPVEILVIDHAEKPTQN
jgi:uncharacterized protein (TIGR03435 family)